MTDLLILKLMGALLTLLVASATGIYPFRKSILSGKAYQFPIGQALTSGIFLGAGLMHMLGDAAQQFYHIKVFYPIAFLLAGVSFLFLLFLEHLGREVSEHQGETNPNFAILAFLMLSLHSVLAGAALGLSHNTSLVIILLLAILAHKWAASFALAIKLNCAGLSVRTGIFLFSVFTLMTPLGILLGTYVNEAISLNIYIAPVFSALAAGTFLYLGTLHGLSRSIMISKCCNIKHFSFVIVGFSIMAVVAIWT